MHNVERKRRHGHHFVYIVATLGLKAIPMRLCVWPVNACNSEPATASVRRARPLAGLLIALTEVRTPGRFYDDYL